jgi:hypothetical protein
VQKAQGRGTHGDGGVGRTRGWATRQETVKKELTYIAIYGRPRLSFSILRVFSGCFVREVYMIGRFSQVVCFLIFVGAVFAQDLTTNSNRMLPLDIDRTNASGPVVLGLFNRFPPPPGPAPCAAPHCGAGTTGGGQCEYNHILITEPDCAANYMCNYQVLEDAQKGCACICYQTGACAGCSTDGYCTQEGLEGGR